MSRVLVVDDEPDILLMLRVALESSGHDVELAADGQLALQAISAGGFSVVLSDVMMPVLDGYGLLAAVKDLADCPPIVIVSARSQAVDIRHALDAGATDFISKPFSPFDLADLVETLAALDAAGLADHRKRRYAEL